MITKFVTFAALTFLMLWAGDGFGQQRTGPSDLRSAAAPVSTTSIPGPGSALGGAAGPANSAPVGLQIGPGDLLEVSLYGIQDFKAEARVSSTGDVSLPMIGSVAVGGLTVEQSEKLIAQKLIAAHLYNDPQVTVFVKEYASEGISVMGEVQKPGIYDLLGQRRLYDAISAAGGMTPKAGRYVMVTRRKDPEHPIRVPVAADAKSSNDNVPLDPGDTVVVSKAGLVYVVGDVKQPGGFVMENDKDITVLQAIALAQGIGANPSLDKAKLIRKSAQGRQDIPIALKKILANKDPDVTLQADDILFIPDSAAKSAGKRGAEAIVQMATGVAIWRM